MLQPLSLRLILCCIRLCSITGISVSKPIFFNRSWSSSRYALIDVHESSQPDSCPWRFGDCCRLLANDCNSCSFVSEKDGAVGPGLYSSWLSNCGYKKRKGSLLACTRVPKTLKVQPVYCKITRQDTKIQWYTFQWSQQTRQKYRGREYGMPNCSGVKINSCIENSAFFKVSTRKLRLTEH